MRGNLRLLAVIPSLLLGCSICANPHDGDFPTYGGLIPRIDQAHGRLGSMYGPQPVNARGTAPQSDKDSPPSSHGSTEPSPSDDATLPESPYDPRRSESIPPPPPLELDDEANPPPVPDEIL